MKTMLVALGVVMFAAGFDSIEVVWPDSTKESLPGGQADRLLALRKGAKP